MNQVCSVYTLLLNVLKFKGCCAHFFALNIIHSSQEQDSSEDWNKKLFERWYWSVLGGGSSHLILFDNPCEIILRDTKQTPVSLQFSGGVQHYCCTINCAENVLQIFAHLKIIIYMRSLILPCLLILVQI